MKQFIPIFAAIVIVLGYGAWNNRVALREEVSELLEPELPQELSLEEVAVPSNDNEDVNYEIQDSIADAVLPEANLSVPFISQAPFADWNLPYQEACEEASVIMAANYFRGVKEISREDANKQILDLVAWQNDRFGSYLDTTAEETAQIMREYFELERVDVIYDFTAVDIKGHLSIGRPVLIPAAGRQLGNPYFQSPGPLYHMLVIKGYLSDGSFITNDPGTRRGANFVYNDQVLMNAIHDWNDGNVPEGERVIIVPYPPAAASTEVENQEE